MYLRNLKIIGFLLIAGLIIFSGTCLAEKKDRPGEVKRRYVHVCPVGAEQVGDGPAKSSIVFCRKHLTNGYQLEGDFVTFYKNGNKKVQGEYLLGKKNGLWQNFKHNGEVVSSAQYKNGRIQKKAIDPNRAARISAFQATPNRPFPKDREVFTKLYETKIKINNKPASKKVVYGISPK